MAELTELNIAAFCNKFSAEEFYVRLDAAIDAVRTHSQFNIIHPFSGLKVDVIVPAATAFNRERFIRAQKVHAAEDLDAYFASPEDVILKKMDYYNQGGFDKHLRDIAGVLKTNQHQIDKAYITKWATQMGLLELWQKINQQVSDQNS